MFLSPGEVVGFVTGVGSVWLAARELGVTCVKRRYQHLLTAILRPQY